MSVEVNHLTKTFGRQKAVNDISFAVKEGSITGFLGPNGAGKSTTMKIATCYIPPTSGEVKINGYDVVDDSVKVRKNLGYLPENNPLYTDMYVYEYLELIGNLYGVKGKDLDRRIKEMISVCGLEPEKRKKIGMLSKGYRQRMGVAQAMLHDPSVLILDEPTSGLDPNQIQEIRDLIKRVGEEKTVLFSTHIMQEVQAICDRVVIIHQGEKVADSSVEELRSLADSGNVVRVEFEKAVDATLLESLEGVQRVETLQEGIYRVYCEADTEIRAKVVQLASEHTLPLIGLQKEESSLEDVFKKLTGR